jgi:hypothetical protein
MLWPRMLLEESLDHRAPAAALSASLGIVPGEWFRSCPLLK